MSHFESLFSLSLLKIINNYDINQDLSARTIYNYSEISNLKSAFSWYSDQPYA